MEPVVTALNCVPIIDLTPARLGSEADKLAVARQIDQAARSIGFLVVRGHGVPLDVIEAASTATRRFYDLPAAEKARSRPAAKGAYRGYFGLETGNLASTIDEVDAKPDHREYFTLGPIEVDASDPYYRTEVAQGVFLPNIWPQDPAFRPAIEAYYRQMERLAGLLMRLCALGLGLEETWFDDKIDKHTTNLVLSNYPDQPDGVMEGQLRAGAHTDYGSLTILKTEDKPGGLEVLTADGRWEAVPIVPDAFIINLGDLMAYWTNDEWVSTMHRVVNPPPDKAIGSRRQSLVFFHQPNYDARIACIPTCTATAPKHPVTTAYAHLQSKMAKMNDTPKFAEATS